MFLKAAGVVIAVLVLALTWQTFKVQGLEKALVVAVVKQEAAETSLRTAQQDKELVDAQLDNFTAKIAVIVKERGDARVQVNKMRDIFQDHDFAKLITKNPGLIENLMIKKTEEVFNEIETLTAE